MPGTNRTGRNNHVPSASSIVPRTRKLWRFQRKRLWLWQRMLAGPCTSSTPRGDAIRKTRAASSSSGSHRRLNGRPVESRPLRTAEGYSRRYCRISAHIGSFNDPGRRGEISSIPPQNSRWGNGDLEPHEVPIEVPAQQGVATPDRSRRLAPIDQLDLPLVGADRGVDLVGSGGMALHEDRRRLVEAASGGIRKEERHPRVPAE